VSVSSHRECERVRELFTAEIDREATEIEEAAIRRHLRTCAECSEAYDAHVAVARGLRQHELVRPARHPLPPLLRYRSQLALAVALVLLAAVVTVFAALR
jgi:predicted anti-sigma-YlaC factor YlaD